MTNENKLSILDNLTQEDIKVLNEVMAHDNWQEFIEEDEARLFGNLNDLTGWLYCEDGDTAGNLRWLFDMKIEEMVGYDTVADYLIQTNKNIVKLPSERWVYIFG